MIQAHAIKESSRNFVCTLNNLKCKWLVIVREGHSRSKMIFPYPCRQVGLQMGIEYGIFCLQNIRSPTELCAYSPAKKMSEATTFVPLPQIQGMVP